MDKAYVYVLRDVVQDAYLIKEAMSHNQIRILYGAKLHAFQWDSELEAQNDLVQQQVRGHCVVLERVDLV